MHDNLPEEPTEIDDSLVGETAIHAQMRTESRQVSVYSVPYPPPDLIREYDEVHKGLGKSLVEEIREEIRHRRNQENQILTLELEERRANVEDRRMRTQAEVDEMKNHDRRARRGQTFACSMGGWV